METAYITKENIAEYLEQHQQKELLRFVTMGSVDDGKSTLIGRLLHDTHGVYEDQLSAVKRATSQRGASQGEEIDFSLFTDGLKAEREQGITIDVAYRYFSTEKRKFIIADTPGHGQYTRNMATGASTANVGIILIDARLGVLQQSRRHAYIASLLGIPRLVVAVNKMDLRDYSQPVFEAIKSEFAAFAAKLSFKEVVFIPMSAKGGDNVVHPSPRLPWYKGPALLSYLEQVPVARDRNLVDFRFPVQHVARPNLNYRGFAGEVASGFVKPGDAIMVLPSRRTSKVVSIDTYEGPLREAVASNAVVLRLADEIDISRGDMLVHPTNLPTISRRFQANMVWMSERPLDLKKSYLMKHTTQLVRVNVESILSVKDLETLEDRSATSLALNDIALVRLSSHRPIFFDAYTDNRATGAFVLIDSFTNNTVAAGMLAKQSGTALETKADGAAGASQVSPQERAEAAHQWGAAVTLSSTSPEHRKHCLELAYQLERVLYDRGRLSHVLGAEGTAVPNSDGAIAAAQSLVAVGVVALIPWAPPPGFADNITAAHGVRALLSVAVTAESVTFAGHTLAVSEGNWEEAANKISDELDARGIFLE
jgi:bifunctional enzyme CysN/CysC